MTGPSAFALIVSAVGTWGVTLLLQAAFLAVILTTVRQRRPDVAPILLLALGLDFLFFLAGAASSLLLPRLVLGGGNLTQYQEAQAISNVTIALGHAVSRGLVIWGIARLAADKPAT